MTLSISTPRAATLRKTLAAGLAALFVAAVSVPQADARMGGGSSFGSRGTRTFSMPPSTTTAPRAATPFGNTETPRYGQTFGGAAGAGMAQPRRFGFGTGLAAGLLGAGVLGMLTGHGFFGGLGGLTSMLGLLLQIGLIVLLVRFAIGFFRNRGNTAFAGPAGGNGMNRSPLGAGQPGGAMGGGGLGGIMGGFGRGNGPQTTPLQVSPDDFSAFERQLSEIQYAYSREDMTALGRLVTPEMLRNLGTEIEATRRRNLRNDLADVRLVQGDLSEAWREGAVDYATVAMRFSCRDTMVDRASGRVMEGDPSRAVEATELWTFRRDNGGAWCLSGVQQSG